MFGIKAVKNLADKTIAAVATPSGSGGIGIIRISGADAIAVADKVFSAASHKKICEIDGYTALFGNVKNESEVIDEAIALLFRAPKSYTGEDVVELSVHGGSVVVKKALRAVIAAGAQLAENGEFTRRAYQNGKMDLIEAEAVMGLISASGEKAQRASLALHRGAASQKIAKIKSSLLTAAAGLSVHADYPDDDLPEFSDETLNTALGDAEAALGELLKHYDAGKKLREGVDAVIAGMPNVGKSTLMNLLSGTKRSIVTPIAGTTRDVVEDTVMLGDITLKLSDTAGLRDSADEIERIGVELSREKINSAGLILAVFDSGSEPSDEDKRLIELCKTRPAVMILNKTDLPRRFDTSLFGDLPFVEISALNSTGTDELSAAVAEVCGTAGLDGNELILCSERQRDNAAQALAFVKEAKAALKNGMTMDIVGVCIDDAMSQLMELTGERVTDAVVDEIFSKFCVGK